MEMVWGWELDALSVKRGGDSMREANQESGS